MIESRLKELGIVLPQPSKPAANYVPFVKVGTLVYISGQLPTLEGKLNYIGRVGEGISIDEGREAARLCGLNILSQLKHACGGDLNTVRRCVRLGGFVNAHEDFTEHPAVINGASGLMVDVFGEQGRHSRAAVGVSSLPFGVAVEVEALFEVKA